MKLYEIHEAIRSLEDQILIDPETGEILCDLDAIQAQIDSLEMDRQKILEYLVKLILNLRAEAAALKEEETRLKKRREGLAGKEDRLMKVLQRECPVTTQLGIATLQYRATSRLEVTDEVAAVEWLKERNLTGCYKQPAPTVFKTEVRKLINSGRNVPGCVVVEDRSASLK